MAKIKEEIEYMSLKEFLIVRLPPPLKVRQWSTEYSIHNEVVKKSGSVLTANQKIATLYGFSITVLEPEYLEILTEVAEQYEEYRDNQVEITLITRFRKPVNDFED